MWGVMAKLIPIKDWVSFELYFPLTLSNIQI